MHRNRSTRLAKEATTQLGAIWGGLVKSFASRLKFSFEISESNGVMVPLPRVEFREASLDTQRKRLVDALDLLEELAAKHKTHLGVIIDEFQEIERLGSEGAGRRAISAMKSVRAAIQRHRRVTYVFAGSDRRLIEKLSAEGSGALYNMARPITIGPIDEGHFATWIHDEFTAMGMRPNGIGGAIIAAAGPRTRDVRTLAETVAELGRERPDLTPAMVDEAMLVVVRQRAGAYEAYWKDSQLTKVQQNLLRAVAAVGAGLTRREVIEKYGLSSASTAVKAIGRLEERTVLLREGNQVVFDDPFLRAWVVMNALPDVGDRFEISYVPPRTA